MERTFKTVQITTNDPNKVNANLQGLATKLHSEKFEVVSHSIYKDDRNPYTLIISVLAKKDS